MEWVQETGRIYAVGEDGKLLAEVTSVSYTHLTLPTN